MDDLVLGQQLGRCQCQEVSRYKPTQHTDVHLKCGHLQILHPRTHTYERTADRVMMGVWLLSCLVADLTLSNVTFAMMCCTTRLKSAS